MRNTQATKSLVGLIDRFIHTGLQQQPDTLRRARILVAVLFIDISVVGCAAIGLSFVGPDPFTISVGVGIDVAIIAGLLLLLRYFRRSANYRFCGMCSVGVIFVPIIIGTMVSGGVLQSPIVHLLPVTLLMAYFFGGIRWGNGMVLIATAVLALLVALELAGIRMEPPSRSPEYHRLLQLTATLVSFAATIGMAFVYELIATRLQHERDQEHQKVLQLAQTDALTGLANRRSFDAMLAERIRLYSAFDPPRQFVLCYLDLDGFKPINDEHGHDIGDEVLRAVSDRLQLVLREADFVGRHGGDEFMLLLDSVVAETSLEQLAQRMLNTLQRPIITSVGALSVTGSLGFAQFPHDAADLKGLEKAADAAMYRAKRGSRSGSGGWCIYTAEPA